MLLYKKDTKTGIAC